MVYVGDEDRDIIAAKKTMIRSIAVTWGYNSQKRLEAVGPDCIVNSPLQIIASLKQKPAAQSGIVLGPGGNAKSE